MKEITIDCGACGGVGYEEGMTGTPPSPVQTDCVRCEGTGQLHHGSLSDDFVAEVEAIKAKTDNLPADVGSALDDIMDRCNDILDKCNDIKEKVDEL